MLPNDSLHWETPLIQYMWHTGIQGVWHRGLGWPLELVNRLTIDGVDWCRRMSPTRWFRRISPTTRWKGLRSTSLRSVPGAEDIHKIVNVSKSVREYFYYAWYKLW
jgi:hypothetical protein